MSQMPDEALSNALVEIVGQENVGDEEALLSSFRREDFESGEKPMLIVKPRDRSEVEELIHLAMKLRINLVPCSSGAPHM